MRYRSYNSELLISTTLVVNVFNDIVIDRRRHGLTADYSKAVTLGDIVQQTIEVPCVLGDRAPIIKSLENEPGKYRMPLIILQMKGIKTDTARMLDLHSDIFCQQDDSFSQLDLSDPMYRPKELSKMRAQPISITYEATFITKYREDLDQIISNFAVHFRPDVYLKWFHPRRKDRPLVSQLTWSHDISYDPMTEYSPQNVFTYKCTSSFTFKSWLFYGMHATDNRIDPELESVIEHIRIFPDGQGDGGGAFGNDDVWVFGNILNTPSGQQELKPDKSGFGFYGVDPGQDFIGEDEEAMRNGQYAVNNVFAENFAPISGDPVFQGIGRNPDAGDSYTTYSRLSDYSKNQYQIYLELDANSKRGVAQFKNVFFKGGFPQSAFLANSPSGDFVFKRFFKSYVGNPKAKSVFGDSFTTEGKLNVNYDIDTKDFTIWADYDDKDVHMYGKSKFNSVSRPFPGVPAGVEADRRPPYGQHSAILLPQGVRQVPQPHPRERRPGEGQHPPSQRLRRGVRDEAHHRRHRLQGRVAEDPELRQELLELDKPPGEQRRRLRYGHRGPEGQRRPGEEGDKGHPVQGVRHTWPGLQGRGLLPDPLQQEAVHCPEAQREDAGRRQHL